MTKTELDACIGDLRELIDPEFDRVHILALDPRSPRHGWGRGKPYDGGPLIIA